jgi:hypothetical protein
MKREKRRSNIPTGEIDDGQRTQFPAVRVPLETGSEIEREQRFVARGQTIKCG